jgi:hypothetical protein
VLLSANADDHAASEQGVSHRAIALDAALALAAVNGLAGLLGLFYWYRSRSSRAFWLLVRVGQALAIAYAALAGILYLAGARPSSGLYYLYALLPVAIGFVAEQLRIISADQVLTAREIPDAQAVGELSAQAQREIVIAIMRREMIVMALAAIVVTFLALRAWGTY